MKRFDEKLAPRKWPGPHAAWGLPGAGSDSFFDRRVQAILLTRKEQIGWPIRCWKAIEDVTDRQHSIPGRKPIQLLQAKDEDEEQRMRRISWSWFANRYCRDPDFVAPLFAAMTAFHAVRPKAWSLARKLACISTLLENKGKASASKIPPPLRNPRKAEMLKKWFGNDIAPNRVSVELSRERRRRLMIRAKWQSHYDFLNEQIDRKFLTHTSNAK